MRDPAGANDGGAITVATYNVHGCLGRDGRFDPDRIGRVIRRLDADVVALQEVPFHVRDGSDRPRGRWLERATGLRAIEGLTLRRPDGSGFGNVLLVSATVLAVHRIDLGVDGREPRGAIDVVVRIGRGQREVRIVATHLGLGAAERLAQARRLIAHLPHRDRGPVRVLVGDLNVWSPGSRTLRLLERAFGPGTRRRTFPAGRPLLALDRVLVSSPARIVAAGTLRDPETALASDHLPLTVRIALPDSTGRPRRRTSA